MDIAATEFELAADGNCSDLRLARPPRGMAFRGCPSFEGRPQNSRDRSAHVAWAGIVWLHSGARFCLGLHS